MGIIDKIMIIFVLKAIFVVEKHSYNKTSYNRKCMEQQSTPKVSVIIPVYNTAAYVRQAIESICWQTLQELEIIVVNDGSTDGSGAILHELAQKDGRIQVYEQENQGQSVARNVGLEVATGRYLYFMDSDDLLEADALELCYGECEAEELDLVMFDAEILNKENAPTLLEGHHYNRSRCMKEHEVYTGLKIMQMQLHHRCYTPSPCLSFIRATYLGRIGLKFHPGIIHEDQLFSAVLYLQVERAMYLCRPFFKRRLRNNSTMTSRFTWRNMEGYLTVARELLRFGAGQSETVRQTIDQLLSQMLNAAVWHAHVMPRYQRLKLLAICLMRYRRYVSNRTLAILVLKNALKQK